MLIYRLYLRRLTVLSLAYDRFEFKSKKHRQKNEQFMRLMLKITNLLIVSIITEYMTLAINGIGIGEYWLCFNHLINVLCIYLSFGANDKLYDILCCCVDNCCYVCCSSVCFCCCLPKDIDDSITVAIEENSKTKSGYSGNTDTSKQSKNSTIQLHMMDSKSMNSLSASTAATPDPIV